MSNKAFDIFYKDNSRIVPGEMGLFIKHDLPGKIMMFPTFTANEDLFNSGNKDFETIFIQSELNSLVNHSDNPNTYTVQLSPKVYYRLSIRPLQAGEEITSNYAQTMSLIKSNGYTISSDWLWFTRKSLASIL